MKHEVAQLIDKWRQAGGIAAACADELERALQGKVLCTQEDIREIQRRAVERYAADELTREAQDMGFYDEDGRPKRDV